MQEINVCQANVHNLKQVSVSIPRNRLVVFTGVSGSGKSSLAFDTIFAEGQRRYIESLSSYARQFMKGLQKPDVESIDGLSPAIAIDQKSTSSSYRSTVGTVTEVYDYLRLLFAKIGQPHSLETGEPLVRHTQESIFQTVFGLPENSKLQILSPVIRGRKGEYNAQLNQWRKEGYVRVRLDGETFLLDELPEDYRLERHRQHTIELVIDRIILKHNDSIQHRLREALTQALKKSDGFVIVQVSSEKKVNNTGKDRSPENTPDQELSFSEQFSSHDQNSLEELAPRLFSFNSPYGACPECKGLGFQFSVNPDSLVPDKEKTLEEGALLPLKKLTGRSFKKFLRQLEKQMDISASCPFEDLKKSQQHFLLFGQDKKEKNHYFSDTLYESGTLRNSNDQSDASEVLWQEMLNHFDGMVSAMEKHFKMGSPLLKAYLKGFMTEVKCRSCDGARLKPFSLSVTLPSNKAFLEQCPNGINIAQLCALSVDPMMRYLSELPHHLGEVERTIARQPLFEAEQRLRFLKEVGLSYLTLNRSTATLSGGESQRIRLASQLGVLMSGVLYVLDEPSIGLHQYNNNQLIKTLLRLRDQGNSLIVVEHDEDTIRAADWVVDIGPKAGRLGGNVVVSGSPEIVERCQNSLTGDYLSGRKQIMVPETTRKGTGEAITLHGANRHNLKNLTVRFPLGQLICVTGLSGSGKSTLVFDLLYPALQNHFNPKLPKPVGYKKITGLDSIDKLINIDQTPIGRTSRSNPATYTGLMDSIRNIFAGCEVSKARGYKSGRFSFNVPGGRCEGCSGEGTLTKSMNVLPDVHVICEQCNGKRYNPETLEVHYQGMSIADVLSMTVREAHELFALQSKIQTWLKVLIDVGLDYIQLGQPAPTLSGGEAQRLKLATEFCKRSTGKTLYLLDEPSVGLHWADLENLLHILNRLTDQGNTVIVIEHNLDCIKVADHVIDMGPEGGEHGGEVVAEGSPKHIATYDSSYTGQFLKRYF